MANSNRFADAIRRIVEPLIDDKIDQANIADRTPIVGTRIYNHAGQVAASIASGQTPPDPLDNPIIKAGTDAASNAALEAAKASLINRDGSGGLNGNTNGAFSGDELLAGTKSIPDAFGGILSPGDPVLEINGLKKCGDESGLEMVVRFDKFFIPPNSEWETADTPPPIADGWDIDYYWVASSFNGNSEGATFFQAGASAMGDLSGYVSPGLYTITDVEYLSSTYEVGDTSGDYLIRYFLEWDDPGREDVWVNYTIIVSQGDCSSPGNPSTSCLTEAPNVSGWPVDVANPKFQLARQENGSFIPSVYDTQVPLEYSTPRTTVKACTEAGTPVAIVPLKNMGWAFYDNTGGVVNGTVQLYNADNTLAGFTDSAGLQNLLP